MKGEDLKYYLIAKLDDCLASDLMSITHELVLKEDAAKAVLKVLRESEYVIRCKDCKWGEADDLEDPYFYLCHADGGGSWNPGDHYCGYAERKLVGISVPKRT